MLAMQSRISQYHCLCTQGAVAFQTPGVFFFTHTVDGIGVAAPFVPGTVTFGFGTCKNYCGTEESFRGLGHADHEFFVQIFPNTSLIGD